MFPGYYFVKGHTDRRIRESKLFFGIRNKQELNASVDQERATKNVDERRRRMNKMKKLHVYVFRPLAILTILLFILAFSHLMKIFAYKIHNVDRDRSEIFALREKLEIDKSVTYMTNRGEASFDYGDVNEAQRDFQVALNNDAYHYRANLGMSKVLAWKCQNHGEYCDLAEQYIDLTISLNTDGNTLELTDLKTQVALFSRD